jgi:uncharacterized protein YdaU (DUF1376 family)
MQGQTRPDGAASQDLANDGKGNMAEFPALPLWTDAYLGDTAHLTNEEHGVYLRLLMFAWRSPDCALPDDDKRLAIMTGLSDKKWRAMRPVVSAFWIIGNGAWTQKRLTKERDFVRGKSEKNRDAAKARWNGKPLANKETHDANAMPAHMPEPCQTDAPTPIPIPNKKEREVNLSRASVETDDCIAHFNAVAERVGWSQVQKITTARKAALIHRMADCGGADAWCEAMDRAASSPFLTGQTGRGWRADFDWLCKAANFTKLMEGNYDPRNSDQGQPRPGQGNSMAEVFMAVGAARSRRAGTSGGGSEWPDGSVQ